MERIDTSTAAAAMPTPGTPGTPGFFTDGNPAAATPATVVNQDWFNNVQEEIVAPILAAGLTLDKTKQDQLLTAIQALIGGAFSIGTRKLMIVNDGTSPDTKIDITADEIGLTDDSGNAVRLTGVNVTVDYAAAGAGGLDTGTLAASTGYHHWLIYNPTAKTVKGLGSLSSSAPTLPSGYTMKRRVGWNHTDGSSNFYRVRQVNDDAQYVVTPGTNTATMPLLASGAVGDVNAPTYVQTSLSSLAPSTASRIRLTIVSIGTNSNAAIYAPNANGGSYGSTSNSPFAQFSGYTSSAGGGINVDMLLESTSVYLAQQANNKSYVNGWKDNI